MHSNVIQINPEVLGGTAVFRGTRVPIQNLFDYLEEGQSVDEFLEEFPSVSREQVVELLRAAESELTSTNR
jgi:uncharacterized protein (DUF433 family)